MLACGARPPWAVAIPCWPNRSQLSASCHLPPLNMEGPGVAGPSRYWSKSGDLVVVDGLTARWNGKATYLRSVLSGDDHGYVGCLRHRRAHRSQQHAGESTTAMTTDDDELR